jgi:hypothetical protein
MQRKYPNAVRENADGFPMVNYSKVQSEENWAELDALGLNNTPDVGDECQIVGVAKVTKATNASVGPMDLARSIWS